MKRRVTGGYRQGNKLKEKLGRETRSLSLKDREISRLTSGGS